MSEEHLSHLDESGNPSMVNVQAKSITPRKAVAECLVRLPQLVIDELLSENELISPKGPVFHTARLAGIMAAKRTGELIPLCHPIGLEACNMSITLENDLVRIRSACYLEAKTGVEMEALTAVTVAALTVYDMCKALSHDITIEQARLLEKSGGKRDFKRQE